MADVMKGWTLSEQGREQEGIDRMRKGLAAVEATATALVRPHFLALLAEALLKVERLDEAAALLDEATTMVENNGERYYEAELYRLKGELLLQETRESRRSSVSSDRSRLRSRRKLNRCRSGPR